MRLQPGRALNIDWLYEVRNSRAFASHPGLAAAVGTLAALQILNPPASGVTVVVYEIYPSIVASGQVNAQLSNTALATLYGTGFNMNAGAAVSVATLRTEQLAGPPGNRIGLMTLPANETRRIGPQWLAVLGAGEGLVALPVETNRAIEASFYWVEF